MLCIPSIYFSKNYCKKVINPGNWMQILFLAGDKTFTLRI